MGVRPEDRPKIIVLLIAIIGFFAYFFLFVLPRLISPQRAAAPPAPAAAPAPAAMSPQASAETARVAANAPAGLDESDLRPGTPIPPAPRDPFRPPVAAPSAAVAAKPNPAPPAAPKPAPVPSVNPLPTITERPLGTQRVAGLPGGLKPAPVLPPPLPEIKLQGVIPGAPAIAVVEVGDKVVQRQEGEKVADSLILARISDSSVTLTHGKRAIVLEVGQSLPHRPGLTGAAGGPLSQEPRSGEVAFVGPDGGELPAPHTSPLPAAVSVARIPGRALHDATPPPIILPDRNAVPPRRFLHRSSRRVGSRRRWRRHHGAHHRPTRHLRKRHQSAYYSHSYSRYFRRRWHRLLAHNR